MASCIVYPVVVCPPPQSLARNWDYTCGIALLILDPQVLISRVGELDTFDATYLLTALSYLASVTLDDGIRDVVVDQLFAVSHIFVFFAV